MDITQHQQQQNVIGNLMYLPPGFWSPRYEKNFYTVKVEGKRLFTSASELLTTTSTATTSFIPSHNNNNDNSNQHQIGVLCSSMKGKNNFPAYYYQVIVYRQHEKIILFRRYSQFYWLHCQLRKSPPVVQEQSFNTTEPKKNTIADDSSSSKVMVVQMPMGTCIFQQQDETFAQKRLEQLHEYIATVLKRPGYANHPAVVTFLELE